jgi:hypothetical protein
MKISFTEIGVDLFPTVTDSEAAALIASLERKTTKRGKDFGSAMFLLRNLMRFHNPEELSFSE